MHAYRPGSPASRVHDELLQSLKVAESATGLALLWFADVLDRDLHRTRGHVSIHAYARDELGFSSKKTEQFVQLARLVLRFPRLRGSLATGRLTWTQVRTVAPALTPASEAHWVARAERLSRRVLAEEIRRERVRVRREVRQPMQVGLPTGGATHGPARPSRVTAPVPATTSTRDLPTASTPTPTPTATHAADSTRPSVPSHAPSAEWSASAPFDEAGSPRDVMTSITLRLRPVDRARIERLVEALRRQGNQRSREEIILAALELLARTSGTDVVDGADASGPGNGPRRPAAGCRPSHQVVVHLCPSCGEASTGVGRDRLPVDPVTVETLLCDADVVDGRGHRRSRIPPSVRRRVLARDGHCCTTPGCGSTRHLEIHHRVPVSRGGSNHPGNLITLCGGCHRSLHELERRRRARPACARSGGPAGRPGPQPP